MTRVMAALVAVSMLTPACATRQSDGGKPVWGLSGQSNAEKLEPYLESYANVIGYSKTSMAIDQWAAPRGPMWVHLAPALSTPMSAFIWWQGEANKNDPAGSYRAKLADLAARIRDVSRQPDLLFAVIRVGPNYPPPDCNIWSEQEGFVAADRHAILVRSDDLEFVDYIHMTDHGYTQMAARIAQTLQATAKSE